jgi:hypothetical protein
LGLRQQVFDLVGERLGHGDTTLELDKPSLSAKSPVAEKSPWPEAGLAIPSVNPIWLHAWCTVRSVG